MAISNMNCSDPKGSGAADSSSVEGAGSFSRKFATGVGAISWRISRSFLNRQEPLDFPFQSYSLLDSNEFTAFGGPKNEIYIF